MRALLLIILAAVVLPAADPAPAAKAGELTFSGLFTWGSRKSDKHLLTAVFTPSDAAKKEWTVRFVAKWKDKDEIYTGTVTGDPAAGAISGKAAAANGKRTWTFSGQNANGELVCKHIETTGGKESPTGDFKIKPGAAAPAAPTRPKG